MVAEGGAFRHVSVLYDECMTALAIKPDGIYVDGTTGGAGHSKGIARLLDQQGSLFCLDRDEDALAAARANFSELKTPATIHFVHGLYSSFDEVLEAHNLSKVDGILLDLGVSSFQLDEVGRGFSYRFDGPLDMRMDQGKGESASELLKRVSYEDLLHILRDYGEEHFAPQIASAIIRYRELNSEIRTTGELVDIVLNALPAKARREKGHPAKRTFQAIRIAVNRELDELERFLAKVPFYLKDGGRLCIISFHSLEDRLIKKKFRKWEAPCDCPKNLPCSCGKKSLGIAIPRNGILPGEDELTFNPRSKSARLRVFCRNAEAARVI